MTQHFKESISRSFRGNITNISESKAFSKKDIFDLTQMAVKALNYLRGNPEPSRNYECKFSLGPLGIPYHLPELVPPNEYGYDPISLGDTDVRMAMQYSHMREIAGEKEPCAVEKGVIARVCSYLRDDGFAWINPAAYVGKPIEGFYIGTWTTGKILYLLSETYKLTGDVKIRKETRKIFEALMSIAQWDNGKAWIPGIVPYKDGKWLTEGWCDVWQHNYPFIVEPLVRYWECTGDEDGLDLARAFTEGFLANRQPDMGDVRINPETGAFTGHVHVHTHAMWGVSHLGMLLKEKRYLDWVEKAYQFVVSRGTDYGWFPEFIPQDEYRTEICVVGDMISNASWLARGGKPNYWDDVERIVRNELRLSRFELTPQFMEFFAKLHHDKETKAVDDAIRELRRIEGGFVAQSTFDDWVSYPSDDMGKAGLFRNGIQMMGCCPPEGMRGIYEAWLGAVEETPDGVYVNMSFNHENNAADVISYAPSTGRLDVTAKKNSTFFLRPPSWSQRETVHALLNGKPADIKWSGAQNAYVRFDNVQKGEKLTLEWQVPQFTQTFNALSIPSRTTQLRVHWLGNTVQSVTPSGKYLPMFRGTN
mgnify:CR=1 FL=1